MVEKNDFIYLLEHHQNFVFFINKDRVAWDFVFNWNEKKKIYRIDDLVNHRSYKSSISDILDIRINGMYLNNVLEYGNIIRDDRKNRIETPLQLKVVNITILNLFTDLIKRCKI